MNNSISRFPWNKMDLIRLAVIMDSDPDYWPYESDFEYQASIYRHRNPEHTWAMDGRIWQMCIYLRKKRSKLIERNERLLESLRCMWIMPYFGRNHEPDRPRPNISDAHIEILRVLYRSFGVPHGKIPYTSTFEKLYAAVQAKTGLTIRRCDVMWALRKNVKKKDNGGWDICGIEYNGRGKTKKDGTKRVRKNGPNTGFGLIKE